VLPGFYTVEMVMPVIKEMECFLFCQGVSLNPIIFWLETKANSCEHTAFSGVRAKGRLPYLR